MREDFINNLPRKFIEVISGAFRAPGKLWIESLPLLIEEIEQNWSVKIEAPFPNLSYHFVAPCLCAGGEAVVKIGFPGEKNNILNEVKMLRHLDGRSVNRLLRFDDTRFAFLLEKLTPGENLKTVCRRDDRKAVEIAVAAMREFWRAPPDGDDFPRLERWFEGFELAARTDFSREYTAKARGFFEELNSSARRKMLLHGDFHHENILSAERAPFLAIDPKGVVGDIGYDISVFLINHANWLKNDAARKEKLSDAVRSFADAFDISPRDLRRWVFAHTVLSAWWSYEENCENWRDELEFTKIWEV